LVRARRIERERAKRTAELQARVDALRSAVAPNESIVSQTIGHELLGGGTEAESWILVSDRRLMWTYARGPQMVLEISYTTVLGIAVEPSARRITLEYDNDEGRGLFEKAGLAVLRLGEHGQPGDLLRYIYLQVPEAARDHWPDFEGSGRRESRILFVVPYTFSDGRELTWVLREGPEGDVWDPEPRSSASIRDFTPADLDESHEAARTRYESF
jgi:hypothetical protein